MSAALDLSNTPPALGVGRSVAGRRWVWRQADTRIGMAIAQRLELPEMVGSLLAARGVGIEQARHFVDPKLRDLLPNPSSLLDMDAAAARLAEAARRGETVAVFGDYDVDGACSGALMVLFLRSIGCKAMHYVPDRLKEGYGPNAAAMNLLCDRGASLIVTVDCGIAAPAAIASVHNRADVIILDHHKAEGAAPICVAAVNPNRLECTSDMRHLCATGVAFLAAIATVRELRKSGFFSDRDEPDLTSLLDLVALATVCDVMPLVGLNRAFVRQGLKVMARRERPGISALLDVTQVKDAPSGHTLGYILGPRINASGRIAEPDLGLRLLTCDDPIEAKVMAEQLHAINGTRQDIEADVLDEAFRLAERQLSEGHAMVLVVGDKWHPGVVGIVAGKIKERYNRPVCAAGVVGEVAKGSGRSVPGIDLGAAIIAARQAGLLETGGGHAMAAGFSVKPANVERLHAFLDERMALAKTLPAAADLVVDAAISARAATTELAEQISQLSPFGNGNDEPIVVIQRARVVKADRKGKDGATIIAFLEGEDGGRLKAVLFRAKDGPLAELLLGARGQQLHVAGHLRAETYMERTTASIHIRDAVLVG